MCGHFEVDMASQQDLELTQRRQCRALGRTDGIGHSTMTKPTTQSG